MKPLVLLLALLLCHTGTSNAQTLAKDDFAKASGNWKSGGMGGEGKHSFQNGRLEFSTNGKSTSNDSASLPWSKDVLRYAESWSVQVDVTLGSFQLGSNPYAGLAVLVHGPDKTKSSFIRLQLRRGDRGFRAFNADGFTNRVSLGSELVPTLSETSAIRIQFDAKAKTLTASYDDDGQGPNLFASFYTVDIGKGVNSWKMKKSDRFNFEIVSQSTNTVINTGDMYFDNLIATKIAP